MSAAAAWWYPLSLQTKCFEASLILGSSALLEDKLPMISLVFWTVQYGFPPMFWTVQRSGQTGACRIIEYIAHQSDSSYLPASLLYPWRSHRQHWNSHCQWTDRRVSESDGFLWTEQGWLAVFSASSSGMVFCFSILNDRLKVLLLNIKRPPTFSVDGLADSIGL